MKIPDKIYDVLKWLFILALPAIGTAYMGLAAIWGWAYAEEVAKTITIICTLGGALIGISTAQYNKEKNSDNAILDDDLK